MTRLREEALSTLETIRHQPSSRLLVLQPLMKEKPTPLERTSSQGFDDESEATKYALDLQQHLVDLTTTHDRELAALKQDLEVMTSSNRALQHCNAQLECQLEAFRIELAAEQARDYGKPAPEILQCEPAVIEISADRPLFKFAKLQASHTKSTKVPGSSKAVAAAATISAVRETAALKAS